MKIMTMTHRIKTINGDQDDGVKEDYQAASRGEGCSGDWIKGGGSHGWRQEGQAGQEDQALVKDQIRTVKLY